MIDYRTLVDDLCQYVDPEGGTLDDLLRLYIETIQDKGSDPLALIFGRLANIKIILQKYTPELNSSICQNLALQLKDYPIPVKIHSSNDMRNEGVLITELRIFPESHVRVGTNFEAIIFDEGIPESTSILLTDSLRLTSQLI